MRARYEVRVGPEHVGERITLRRRNDVPGEPPATDVIGHLRAWEDDVLHVERKDGRVVEVPAADLLAARVLGPPPQRVRGGYNPTDGD